MLLNNNTPQDIFYTISTDNASDCGTIKSGDTANLPYYDNQTDVTVGYFVQSSSQTPPPFQITIPNTSSGKVVTIGFYVE